MDYRDISKATLGVFDGQMAKVELYSLCVKHILPIAQVVADMGSSL